MCLKTKTKTSTDLPGNFWRERKKNVRQKSVTKTCDKNMWTKKLDKKKHDLKVLPKIVSERHDKKASREREKKEWQKSLTGFYVTLFLSIFFVTLFCHTFYVMHFCLAFLSHFCVMLFWHAFLSRFSVTLFWHAFLTCFSVTLFCHAF